MRKFLILLMLAFSPLAMAQSVTTKFEEDGVGAYRAAFKKAAAGERVILVLGADDGLLKADEKAYRYTKYAEWSAVKDMASGVYECYKGEDGGVRWDRRVKLSSASATCSGGTCGVQSYYGGTCSNGSCSGGSFAPNLTPFQGFYQGGGCANGTCQQRSR